MESLGQYLRREREARGVALEDIARVTRIRRQHLEMLEADRHDALPATPFVRGFLAAYAKQLGLPPDEVVGRYHAALGAQGAAAADTPRDAGPAHGAERRESVPVPAETAGRGSPPLRAARPAAPSPLAHADPAEEGGPHRGVLALAGVVAVAAIAVVASMLARPPAVPVRSTQRPVAPPLPLPPVAVEPTVQPVVPAVAAPSPAAAAPTHPAPRPSPAARPALAARPTPDPAPVEATVPEAAAQPPVAVPAVQAVPATATAGVPAGPSLPAGPAVAAPAVAAAPAARVSTLTVAAAETTVVQVAIDGGTPVEAMLNPGDRASWRGSTFDIVLSNAGGVTLDLDGVRHGSLGESGRRVSLRLPRPTAP
jgi:transcriptional regulator with XRE-family HTH domain